MATFEESVVVSKAIRNPALPHKFIVSYGVSALGKKTPVTFDSKLVSQQTVDVKYSLSTKTVSLKIEEPQTDANVIASIVSLPDIVYSINIFNSVSDEENPMSGVSLFDLSLENHYCERAYNDNSDGTVNHYFRFKFENVKAVEYNP